MKMLFLAVSQNSQESIYAGISYWTPSLGRKGPIKYGLFVRLSVCPSVRQSVRPSVPPSLRLSVSFLRIRSLVFSETQYGVRSPYLVMCDIAGFYEKNPHRTKMTKNGQKWPKNMVLRLFKKITSLVLSGICVK